MHDAYVYSHFSLVAARSQKMEAYEVDSYVCVWNPTIGKPVQRHL